MTNKFQTGAFAVISVGATDEQNVGKVVRLVAKTQPVNGREVWAVASVEPLNTRCGLETHVARIEEFRLTPIRLEPILAQAQNEVLGALADAACNMLMGSVAHLPVAVALPAEPAQAVQIFPQTENQA
jgi:hypothetical protein